MQILASGRGGIGVGEHISIGVEGNTGYRVTSQRSDGSVKSFTVEMADRSSAERSVGALWRSSTARMVTDTSSTTNTDAVQRIMSETNTLTSTEQATHSWRQVESIERRVAEEKAQLMRSGGSYEAALIRWYGDQQYPDTPAKERYAEAASDLQQMVLTGDSQGIEGIIQRYLSEKK